MDEIKTEYTPIRRVVLILCVLSIYAGLCLIILSPILSFLVHREYAAGIGLVLLTSAMIIGTLTAKIRWSFVELARVFLFLTAIIGSTWEVRPLLRASLAGLVVLGVIVWKDNIVRGIKEFL